MKFRIIQNGNGHFIVQKKEGLFGRWDSTSCRRDDYPDEYIYEGYDHHIHDNFPNIELAKSKLCRLVNEAKKEKLKDKFKVIEEHSV